MPNPEKYPFNGWDAPLVEFDEWTDKIREESYRKFGVDSDGDSPVNILFVDRTKYEPVHWWLVPYEHKAKTEKDMDEIERAVTINLETALRAMKRFLEMKRMRKEQRK